MYDLLFTVALLVAAYFIGRGLEVKHYRSIRNRERASKRMAVITAKTFDPGRPVEKATLVTGHVVVSVDYFKRFLASLRNIFGGRVKSYETLLDRARREAVLRMKKDALDKGASVVINARLETSAISKHRHNNRAIGAVEVLAYGTALKLR